MKFIIGLGNPIEENYTGTRHNIGFDVLFKIVSKEDFVYDKYSSTLQAKTQIGDREVFLILPQLYMNNSGESITAVAGLLEAFAEGDVLVVHDEIDIPFGSIRISKDSGSGGHNGVRSIIKKIGHTNFPRLRIGIAPLIDGVMRKPGGGGNAATFVLKKFTPSEQKALDSDILKKSAEAVRSWVKEGVEKTANKYN